MHHTALSCFDFKLQCTTLHCPKLHFTALYRTALSCTVPPVVMPSWGHYSCLSAVWLTLNYTTLHTAHLTLHTPNCKLKLTPHNAHCTLHTTQCTLQPKNWTLLTAHSTLNSAHCTLHFTLCLTEHSCPPHPYNTALSGLVSGRYAPQGNILHCTMNMYIELNHTLFHNALHFSVMVWCYSVNGHYNNGPFSVINNDQ